MIKIDKLSYRTSFGRSVFDKASVCFATGGICGLIGMNGSGKSTLLRLIASRDVSKYASNVEYGNGDCSVFYFPQRNDIHSQLLVGEVITFLTSLSGSGDFVANNYWDICGVSLAARIGNIWKRPFRTLSGGEKQVILVSIALAVAGDYALLDEPFNGLDPLARDTIWQLMENAAARGRGIVVATRILEELGEHQTSICLINRGLIFVFPDATSFRTSFGGRTMSEAFKKTYLNREGYSSQPKQP